MVATEGGKRAYPARENNTVDTRRHERWVSVCEQVLQNIATSILLFYTLLDQVQYLHRTHTHTHTLHTVASFSLFWLLIAKNELSF